MQSLLEQEKQAIWERVSHEVELWLHRQVIEHNIGLTSIPMDERIGLVDNVVTAVFQTIEHLVPSKAVKH